MEWAGSGWNWKVTGFLKKNKKIFTYRDCNVHCTTESGVVQNRQKIILKIANGLILQLKVTRK